PDRLCASAVPAGGGRRSDAVLCRRTRGLSNGPGTSRHRCAHEPERTQALLHAPVRAPGPELCLRSTRRGGRLMSARPLSEIFGAARPLVGMVHLLPLPGAPLWRGSMDEVLDRAVADARALARGG